VDRYVRPFEERKCDLVAELEPLAEEYDREFTVRELSEPTGIATEPQFDALIVSPETVSTAERINELRREMGNDSLRIEVVDHVPAVEGERSSSTRIVNGESDRPGTPTPARAGRDPMRER
jgi:pantetheine-phosphate adenylyltransferase